MEKLKSLTAEELFFLGRLINGPYIDYAYVAAMDDIQHAYNSHEQKNMMSLQKKGLVFENFLGETSLMEKGNDYRPIFFGKDEGRLEICGSGGEMKLIDIRFHFLESDGIITMMRGKDIDIWSIKTDELETVLRGMMNLPQNENFSQKDRTVTIKNADKVYVVTFGSVSGKAGRIVLYEKDGTLFDMKDENNPDIISSDNAIESVIKLFTEEVK